MFNQKGMSIVMVLMLSLVGLIVVMGITSAISTLNTRHQRAANKEKMVNFRNNIISVIENDLAWSATRNHSSNSDAFTCLSSTCSVSMTPQAIDLYDQKGNEVHRNGGASRGYNYNFETCTSFSSSGSDTCPIKLRLTWQPVCRSGETTCSNPIFQVNGTFEVRPGSGLSSSSIINTAGINFVIERGVTNVNSLSGTCAAMGGTFVYETQRCVDTEAQRTMATINENLKSASCPTGKYVARIKSNGSVTCCGYEGSVWRCD